MRPFATYLTLRLTHESSDPSTVTHLLERIPTRAHRANQVIQLNGRTKMIKRSAWILSSEEHVNSADIDDHIQWMMDQMKGQRENVLRLNDSGWAIALNVMWDSQTGHGGPVFSARTLGWMSEIRGTLEIDSYFIGAYLAIRQHSEFFGGECVGMEEL
jgi:Domain of unknown function (DUF4279)